MHIHSPYIFNMVGSKKRSYLDLLLAMADPTVSATDLARAWEKCADLRRRASQHQLVSRIHPIQVFLLMAMRIKKQYIWMILST